jgi:hypothetical protein
MDVDFAAAVVYDPERPDNNNNAKGTASTAWAWDPTPTTCDRAATEACVWVDPFWTGVTCQRIGPPVVMMTPPLSGESRGRRRITSTIATPTTVAVFRVRGRISPVKPSTLQRLAGEWPANDESRGMCNSIKVHFFRTSREEGGEVRRDFLYSSAFPLEELLPLSAASFAREQQQLQSNGIIEVGSHYHHHHHAFGRIGGEYGLFNYNRMDVSSDPIPGMRLITMRLGTVPTVAPHNAVVYAIQGE